jgi:hypothetical protein
VVVVGVVVGAGVVLVVVGGGVVVVPVVVVPVVVVPVVDVPVVVEVVVAGDAWACAGTTIDCTTGRTQDWGTIAKRAPAPTAFKSGRRLDVSSLMDTTHPQIFNRRYRRGINVCQQTLRNRFYCQMTNFCVG